MKSQDNAQQLTAREETTQQLYKTVWVEFNEQLVDEAIVLFAKRLELNDFDMSWFQSKTCLDAGCGGGRYSIAMAQLGAKEVIGVDIGDVTLAERRAGSRGLSNVRFERASILDLPYEDNSFDFVCNNGVLMITEDPDKGLAELHRVLRPGGLLFLYVFGDGGIYWKMADVLRALLHTDVPLTFAQDILKMAGVPANRRFNFLDLSYAPIQNRYTAEEMTAWLSRRGFNNIRRLMHGMSYDTNQKIVDDPELGPLFFGEGDLRYLATKA